MKDISLIKAIIFYVITGTFILLIIECAFYWVSATADREELLKFDGYKDVGFLLTIILVSCFSFISYKRSYQYTAINYQKLFNGSPLPMYLMEKKSFKILGVNEAMVDLYGYSASEFLEMTALDIRPNMEHRRIVNFLTHYAELTVNSGNWLHKKKNGECFYVQIAFHSVPLNKNGAYLVMIKDIDRSINDEKRIKDLIHLYETVNKATNDVIWDYDLITDQITWMQGYSETYGYDKNNDLSGFWAMNKIHPEDRERVKRAFKNTLEQKRKDWFAEYRYLCADGSAKYVRDRGYVIFNQDNDAVRMIGALQDIDKQKKYEQQLLNQNDQLKEIAWINSHEVRRPLSNILGLVGLIKGVPETSAEVAQLIDLLAVSAEELDHAVIMVNRQTIEATTSPPSTNIIS